MLSWEDNRYLPAQITIITMRWVSDSSQRFNRIPCNSIEIFCCTPLLICADLCICDSAELLTSSGSKALPSRLRNLWGKGREILILFCHWNDWRWLKKFFFCHYLFHVTKRPFSFGLLFLWTPAKKKRKKQHPQTPKTHLTPLPPKREPINVKKSRGRGMSCRKRSLFVAPGSRNKCINKKEKTIWEDKTRLKTATWNDCTKCLLKLLR